MHFKRFVVLAITTVVVLALAVIGLLVMNDEMQKALTNTHNNVYSTSESSPESQPETNDVEVKW